MFINVTYLTSSYIKSYLSSDYTIYVHNDYYLHTLKIITTWQFQSSLEAVQVASHHSHNPLSKPSLAYRPY